MTVGVALAVYNGERFLKQQLNSLIGQTFKDFKVYIKDDGSTDRTGQIAQEFVKKYPSKFEYHLNTKRLTPKDNFYSIIKGIDAPYIMFCDQDDVWLKDKIEITLNHMKQKEKMCPNKPILIHTDLIVADEELNILSKSMAKSQKLRKNRVDFNHILVQNNVTGCTVMINNTLKKFLKSMPKEAIMHDWWLALIATAFGELDYIDKPTILYRQHSSNNVGAKKVTDIKFILEKMLKSAQIKKSINDTYSQAEAFLKEFGDDLDKERRCVLKRYIAIKDYGKFGKIRAIKRDKFYKYGALRKIGQILYI